MSPATVCHPQRLVFIRTELKYMPSENGDVKTTVLGRHTPSPDRLWGRTTACCWDRAQLMGWRFKLLARKSVRWKRTCSDPFAQEKGGNTGRRIDPMTNNVRLFQEHTRGKRKQERCISTAKTLTNYLWLSTMVLYVLERFQVIPSPVHSPTMAPL